MNRRKVLQAMLGGPLMLVGCKEKAPADKPAVVDDRKGAASIPMKPCTREDLYRAIEEVECEGIPFHERTYVEGRHGELGPLQITKQYVDDVNRINKERDKRRGIPHIGRWVYLQRSFRAACHNMMSTYWDHYATPQRLGHEPALEDLARIHNGGPNGWKKKSTEAYWAKVRAELERMEA